MGASGAFVGTEALHRVRWEPLSGFQCTSPNVSDLHPKSTTLVLLC